MSFSKKILQWYAQNKRDLPWRKTRDPYRIWLSEIMLQQTRVAQGIPYYHRFIKSFPKVEDLAAASEEEVLKLWQGLGYYSRARNLHATAKLISEEYQGKFPSTYKELIKLKGVGDYTASAIASICFDAPEAVVDGNVYRVLARYFGVNTPINSAAGISYFKELAQSVMDSAEIRDYNQGIMEFGAIQCAPKKPYCLHCPLNDSCLALQQNKVLELPIKLKKTKVKNRYFNYLVFLDSEQKTQLNQRLGKGIWQQLYEFPLIEAESTLSRKAFKKELEIKAKKDQFKIGSFQCFNEKVIVHKLSHQHLYTQFWIVKIKGKLPHGISLAKLETYPVPVLISEFMETFKNSYF